MNWLNQVDRWQDEHRPVAYDYGRIALGLFIFYKGLMFIADTEALAQILQNSQFQFVAFGLAHYVAFAHLVGGPFIAMGLKTRKAIAFQLPILLGAVFFVNPEQGFFSVNTEFTVSLITLLALMFYFAGGSGYYSVDHRLKANERRLTQQKQRV